MEILKKRFKQRFGNSNYWFTVSGDIDELRVAELLDFAVGKMGQDRSKIKLVPTYLAVVRTGTAPRYFISFTNPKQPGTATQVQLIDHQGKLKLVTSS